MFPKNLAPVEPPGIVPIIIQKSVTTCSTAQTTVNGVLLRYNAEYRVAIKVNMYKEVVRARSLLNIDLRCAQGPYKKLKLNIKNMLPNVNSNENFIDFNTITGRYRKDKMKQRIPRNRQIPNPMKRCVRLKVKYSFCTFSNHDVVLLAPGLSSLFLLRKLGVENDGKLKL